MAGSLGLHEDWRCQVSPLSKKLLHVSRFVLVLLACLLAISAPVIGHDPGHLC